MGERHTVRAFLSIALISIGLILTSGSRVLLAADPVTSVTGLIGTWGGERDFGPEVRGTLVLRRAGSRWLAEIAGYRVSATNENGVIAFEVPGDRGSFRGRLNSLDGAVEGQWIQPGVIGNYGQRFSTPTRLDQVGPALWKGEVIPLSDRVRVFLQLEPEEEGRVRAWMRNPELNFGRVFDLTEVVREDERIEFRGTLSWAKHEEPTTLLDGVIRDGGDTVSVFVENLGGTYDLRRIDGSTDSPFYPRARANGNYEYVPPAVRADGWSTADLESVGMTRAPIEALVKKIITTPIDAIDAPHIDAVLVARDGKLVLEEYFHGNGPERPHDTRSASKSITSMIVGSAIHAGYLSLDSGVYETMYGGNAPADLDPRASRMTIEHLITMSSGLACDDWDSESPGGEDRMQNQSEQADWYRYTLDLPIVREPGEKIAYCSAGMSLAGGVVARASGMLLTEFFDRFLARPLQMGTYHTNLMPSGEGYAGGGLRVTGRDFLKFGQLLLDDGEWNGRRILDEGWARASLARHYELSYRGVEGYGYGWWRFAYEIDGKQFSAFYAGGNGGNYIIGVPDLDLVIVFLASNYNQSVMHETKYEYVPEFILRSVLDGQQRESVSPDTDLTDIRP